MKKAISILMVAVLALSLLSSLLINNKLVDALGVEGAGNKVSNSKDVAAEKKVDALGRNIAVLDVIDTSAPLMDGSIKRGEYKYKQILTSPGYYVDNLCAPVEVEEEIHSSQIELYYSHDEEYIYIGMIDRLFYESAENYSPRANYQLRFGFNSADISQYVQKGVPFSTALALNGSFTANDEKLSGGDVDAYTNGKNTTVDKIVVDSVVSVTGSSASGIIQILEMKLSKAKILNLLNTEYEMELEECPNIMFFSFRQQLYVNVTDAEYSIYSFWNATQLTDEQKAALETEFDYAPGVIVFGSEFTDPYEAISEIETETTAAESTDESVTEAATVSE